MTDTNGLSRKEHLLVKIEDGEPFTAEEWEWAAEVLTTEQRAQKALDDAMTASD